MDLRVYYQKIREAQKALREGPAVLVSLETPDGGKAGALLEAPPAIAAKMLVEGRARLATEAEAQEFQQQCIEAKRRADELAAASRMQVTVVSASDLRELKSSTRPAKG